jgi:diguanylate cyclase (GGDEF)-like protein
MKTFSVFRHWQVKTENLNYALGLNPKSTKMVQRILSALRQVTEERDVDSLEMTLMATLLEHFKCTRVNLLEIIDQNIEQKSALIADDEGEITFVSTSTFIDDSVLLQKLQQSRHPIFFPLNGEIQRIVLPLILDEKTTGAIEILSPQDLTAHAIELGIFVEIYQNYLVILNDSERDKLTQLFNRRTFEKKLSRLIANRQQILNDTLDPENRQYDYSENIYLAVVDVDHFKSVNDQFGHICGDEVLLKLANVMRESFRRDDLLFRFGGEEFIVVLAPTSADTVEKVLERFRKTVEDAHFPLVESITVSIGYDVFGLSEYPLQVVEKADKALYFVKENGRNSVRSYQKLLEEGLITHVHTQADTEVDLF